MDKICKVADIIMGIPSLNEADNIAFVARQLALGLKKYFPTHSAAIINVDNNSKDGTNGVFLGAETDNIPKRYISTEEAIVGKGNNMRNLCSISVAVNHQTYVWLIAAITTCITCTSMYV